MLHTTKSLKNTKNHIFSKKYIWCVLVFLYRIYIYIYIFALILDLIISLLNS
jgi:hypothetical protein